MTEENKRMYDSLKLMNDDYLIQLTVLNHGYTDDYISLAKNILVERKIEIDYNDINFYVDTFANSNEIGWQKEIKNMFSELIANGWNLKIPVKSKEKYGNFICDIETKNIKLQSIVDKYTKIINRLCSNCGSNENVFNDQTEYWIENICEKCWINKIENRYTVSDISENGFKYFLLISNNKFEPKYFEWSQVKSIVLTIPDYGTDHELEINFSTENLYLNNRTDINFFKLLKFIPKEKISSINYDYIQNLFLNLKSCTICGKIAVHNGTCLVCKNSLNKILSNSRNVSWKRFNNIERIIKNEQESFQDIIKYSIVSRYRFQNDISFDKDLNFIDFVNRN